MAGQVFCTIYNQGTAFQHSVVFDKGDPASWVHEFDHQVLYLGNKPFFDRIPIRVHKPVRLYIPIDKIAPSLIQKVIQGEAVEKVMLRWFRYQEKTKSDSEYFRHIFETVSFDQCRFVMPDAKNPLFDSYDHALEISFRYKKVTWIYMQGNLMVSDEWHGAESEEGEESEEEETTEEQEAVVEAPVEDTGKKVTLSEAKFLPEEGKTDFNQKCNVTVNIAYIQETTKKKVLFKLFSAYNNNTQDMQHEIEAFESGGKADAAVTLHYNDEYFSDTAKPADASVEYFVKVTHPEADEVESERLKLPFKKQQTVQFIEIPDVLFNHNSAVPMIDEGEKLINAVITSLDFASKNADKEAVIYGHTDSSGETDYNLKLSELRCKTVKAFIDNKPQEFVSICKDKSKVEDYQTFLSVLTKKYSWECDPGAIDNQDGPKTKEALKQFQIDYNLFYGKSIGEDGKIGPETWEAFFNVIMEQIHGSATTEAGDSAPKLKYGKNNGIYPCGEKYAQEAYAKKGRKSQKDRRVEIVFNDPSQPIEDTPYVDTIVMEPIEIVADKPEKTLKSIVLNCKHREKFKGSSVQYLGVVPAPSDTVTLKANVTTDTAKIVWKLSGAEKKDLEGRTASLPVGGYTLQAANLIPALLNDSFLAIIPPKKVYIKAIDESQKAIKALLEIYPYNTNTQEIKIPTGLKKIIDWAEKINELIKKKFDTRLSFKFLEGKVSLAVNWAEDQDCEKVYPAFELKGGFSPVVGIEWTGKIQLIAVLNAIPEKIRKYIAEIYAFLTVAGNLELTVGIAKISYNRIAGKGTIGGTIGVSVGLAVEIGNKKILALKGQLSSSVGAEASIQYKQLQNESVKKGFYFNAEGKFGALKGTLSFELFDGLYARNAEVILISEEKWPIAEDIPLFGSEGGEK